MFWKPVLFSCFTRRCIQAWQTENCVSWVSGKVLTRLTVTVQILLRIGKCIYRCQKNCSLIYELFGLVTYELLKVPREIDGRCVVGHTRNVGWCMRRSWMWFPGFLMKYGMPQRQAVQFGDGSIIHVGYLWELCCWIQGSGLVLLLLGERLLPLLELLCKWNV